MVKKFVLKSDLGSLQMHVKHLLKSELRAVNQLLHGSKKSCSIVPNFVSKIPFTEAGCRL